MKYIVLLISLFFIHCKAQSPVLPRYDNSILTGDIDNAYYKDITNFHGQFEGTWLYNDGTKTIKVVFQKRNMILKSFFTISYYEDHLIGEIQYTNNGQEVLNSLPNLNVNYPNNIWKYSMVSMAQLDNQDAPVCPTCPAGTLRLMMQYSEQGNDDDCLEAEFVMYKIVENGIEKLKVNYYLESEACGKKIDDWGTPSTTTAFKVPYGEYTFIKQ